MGLTLCTTSTNALLLDADLHVPRQARHRIPLDPQQLNPFPPLNTPLICIPVVSDSVALLAAALFFITTP